MMLSMASMNAQNPINKKDSLAFVNASWETTVLGRHAISKCASIDMFNSTQFISVIEYKAKKYNSAILQLEDGKLETTDTLAQQEGYTIAANGSYFNVKTFYPATYVRIGDKTYGETQSKELFRVNGVIGFKDRKGHKPIIKMCDNTEYDEVTSKWASVLAAGPILVIDSKRISYDSSKTFFTKRHPRTLMGYDDKGNIILAVIDGRFPQGIGATIDETAIIAKLLGMKDAINLDGGGSSTIWSESTGVLNHPYDNRKFDHEGQRKVTNCIAARRR